MAKIIGYIVDNDGTMKPVTDTPASAPATEPAQQSPDKEPQGDADSADTSSGSDGTQKPYEKWKKPDLEAEVASRNEGRDDEDLIEVEGKGTVADLAAALIADDAAHAE